MKEIKTAPERIPAWSLYGEKEAFPDVLHCERITDRAAGLDWIIAPHRHPHLHQFFLICSGEVEMNADGARLLPEPPCVFSIPRRTVHGFTFSTGTIGYVVTVPLQSLPDIFGPDSSLSAPISVLSVAPADEKITEAFVRLHAEHEARQLARTAMLKSLAGEIACMVLRRTQMPDESSRRGATPRYRQFEELVLAHFKEGWSLEDYSREIGISVRQLTRICQHRVGQTPAAYVESIRMQEACRMLVYTREGISAIGYQLGFEDPSYFSRAFRRHTGHTPRDYRTAFEQE